MRQSSPWIVAAASGLALLLGTTLGACSGPNPAAQSPESEAVNVPQSAVVFPDTPVGQKAQMIIDILNAEEDSTAAQWESDLSRSFLNQVSTKELTHLFNTSLRPARPFAVTAYQGTENDAEIALTVGAGEPLTMSLSLNSDGKISGLLFSPATTDPNWQEPASLEEVKKRLEELPVEVSALVIKDNETLIDIDSERSMPLGSAFKLYVLLAVAKQVGAGTLSWDDTVTVSESSRSLPSGELQDAPEGTTVPVSEAASKMISISDNTATDLLIDLVGREAVEKAVADSGHHDPGQMRPFLKTREMFQLMWGDPRYLERWADADETDRRALLKELATKPLPDLEDADMSAPAAWPKGGDWFASATDIAAVHRALHSLQNPTVSAALTKNPGVEVGDWPFAAFKGGSSLGVLTVSWLLDDHGKTAIVVALTRSNDPAATNGNEQELFGLAQATIRLIR